MFDDGGGGRGGGCGGVNNHESLNIDSKLLITPQYPQVKTARVKGKGKKKPAHGQCPRPPVLSSSPLPFPECSEFQRPHS